MVFFLTSAAFWGVVENEVVCCCLGRRRILGIVGVVGGGIIGRAGWRIRRGSWRAHRQQLVSAIVRRGYLGVVVEVQLQMGVQCLGGGVGGCFFED